MNESSRLIDISVPLTPATVVWPGDPQVSVEPVSATATGDDFNVALLRFSSHTGTHVDAPWHALDTGHRLGETPLSVFVGPCWVCDLRHLERQIEASDLAEAGIPRGTERLLLKTRNSDLWNREATTFAEDFIALTPGAARWVVERGIRLVGIDYLSVEPFDGDGAVHHSLLQAGVTPLETLDLRRVEPGRYTLICLPLNLPAGDGAPCRALLAAPGTLP